MILNYLKIAFRNLLKHKGFSFINIFGLAAGITCCLLITLYVMDELSFDRYHEKADRIYRINTDIRFGGNDMRMAVTCDPMGPTLKKDYPQVESFARVHSNGSFLVKKGGTLNNLKETHVLYADSTIFDVFSFLLIAGNPKLALTEPNVVVISESAAKRHFGSENPMGQVLRFDNDKDFKVTGVMKDIPKNSHFQSDFFLSMKSDPYNWGSFLSCNHHTYIVLKPGTDYKVFEKNFDQVLVKYVGPQIMQAVGSSLDDMKKSDSYIRFWLMPLTDINLHSKQTIEIGTNGDIQYVYIFSAVALFVLLIACINFMNLSTARSSKRAKEVGVRKVLGSVKTQLIGQFFTESILMAFFAMILGLVFVALLLPFFNDISSKQLTINNLFNPQFLPFLFLLPLVVGLLAGSYPALFLSSFEPITVLKGRLNLKGGNLRNILVVFQFATSIILIVGTVVVYRQISYIQTKKLGFNKDQVLIINEAYALDKQAETFKNQILELPGVVSGTLSGFLPTPSNRSDNPLFPEGQLDPNKAVSLQNWTIDYDYINTLGMDMVKGRNFSREFGSDSSGMILNEAAAKLFGFKDPIGQRVMELKDSKTNATTTYTIVGVVKDFHFESLRSNIGALCLKLGRSRSNISFRLNAQTDVPTLVKQIESKWKNLAPGQPFSYSFMDDSFNNVYRAEQRVGKVSLAFAFLTILIACLGLFGLATFIAEQRTKEIGIRKVLGSSVPQIVSLLSKDFIKLVVIALLVATPVAWYAMSQWLKDFAYRIEISWWIFIVAGVVAILIALFTVSYQAIRSALMNPVKSLKSE